MSKDKYTVVRWATHQHGSAHNVCWDDSLLQDEESARVAAEKDGLKLVKLTMTISKVEEVKPAQKEKKDEPTIVYGVPWLEVEPGWGSRPEGYALFNSLKQCIEETKVASRRGPYEGPDTDGRYCGPMRPLCYYEIPFVTLDEDLKEILLKRTKAFTPNLWSPNFKSGIRYIK